ncbi:MAG TPA: LamG-like jellyroll fold domain-containing protein [Kofleriaceae bacterium]|nr:LamG-like jellyroll fold domain-containing protein [Kofleriaceae bacterium]
MRGTGVTILMLIAGCRFDLPPEFPAKDDAGANDAAKGTPYKKLITIDQARVSGGQAQFPVWIALDGDADLKAHATDEGADIYFTADDGTPLPHEIQGFSRELGRLGAWVRTDLNAATQTVLELRYGDPSTASAPRPAQVFSSSFAAVWHLDDSLATDAVADATGNRPGSAGGLGPADQVAARLGGGIDFDGVDDRVLFTNPYTGGGDHTISAWVFQRTATGYDTIVTLGSPTVSRSRWLNSHHETGVSAGFYGNDWSTSTNPLPSIDNAGWVLLHWTFKGGSRQSRIYRDGTPIGQPYTFSGGIDTLGPDGNIGYAPAGWGTWWLNGILDEVRLATAERSAGWIATEFANQSSPQTFYTVGAEEPVR